MLMDYPIHIDTRTSDSLNEGLPIKMTREKFQRKQDKFDKFISPYEGLFERNMYITKHKSQVRVIFSCVGAQIIFNHKNRFT